MCVVQRATPVDRRAVPYQHVKSDYNHVKMQIQGFMIKSVSELLCHYTAPVLAEHSVAQ